MFGYIIVSLFLISFSFFGYFLEVSGDAAVQVNGALFNVTLFSYLRFYLLI